MAKGKIIEEGNHEKLLQKYPDGLYAKFVKEELQSEQNPKNDFEKSQDWSARDPSKHTDQKKKAVDPVLEKIENEKKAKFDAIDEEKDKSQEDYKEALKNGNHISRVFKINEPKWLIFFGTFIAACNGAVLPFIGIYIGKMLFVLQPTGNDANTMNGIRKDSDLFCLIMFLLSCGAFIFSFFQLTAFGVIGENVTLVMRKQLYASILGKHIGWFDEKDHSPGQLSSTMATEAQVINGVISGGIASSL